MHDPKAVARTMIEKAATQNIAVTNLTLQKLLYFAHGLMLAKYDRPLVNQSFQAWKYGPVLEGLYHDLKMFGPSKISPNDGFVPWWPTLQGNVENEITSINAVLQQLGPMSGGALINISHDINGPWYSAYQATTKNICIDNEKIKSYFKTLVK